MKINRSYKYAIYPNKSQRRLINSTFKYVNFMYDTMLRDKTKSLRETGKTGRQTPAQYKDRYIFLNDIDSLALCNMQLQLEAAFKGYFDEKTSYPKERRNNIKCSYTTNHLKNNIRIENNKLIIPKVGALKIKLHRQLPINSFIKSVTISKDRTNKYFASIMFEYCVANETYTIDKDKVIGLDYSPSKFYIDSNNNSVSFPIECEKTLERINYENSKLSNLVYKSSNWEKQNNKINKLYIKYSNQQKDFLHKLANNLANEYDVVCIEDIDLKNMSKRYNLGRYVQTSSFGVFRDMLKYKLEEKGKYLVVVNKYYPSSKLCSNCGYINKSLMLSDRTWECPECHTIHQRDYNAAINIRNYVYNKKFFTVGHTVNA